MRLLANDWAGYRADAQRSGFSDSAFPRNAVLSWTFHPGSRPRPAWPAPARRSYWQQLQTVSPRVVDDHAFHPVIAGTRVLFGSSGDDHLYCLDAETGRLEWRFGTDGPVRYAPFVAEGRVFFGSDDGVLYCVALNTGKPLWQRRLAETDLRIPGNGRLVSAWPVRTGCVVVGDRVYATSGLYPQQGSACYALDVATGEVVWRRALEISPQGYLLASRQQLFIPAGRGQPLALNLADGFEPRRMQTLGGTFAVVDDGILLGGRGNDGSLGIVNAQTGARLTAFRGEQMVVGPKHSLLYDGEHLSVLDRAAFQQAQAAVRSAREELKTLQSERRNVRDNPTRDAELKQRSAVVAKELAAAEAGVVGARRELLRFLDGTALVGNGEVAIIGGGRNLRAVALQGGEAVWERVVPAPVRGLALAAGRLVATLETGEVLSFAVETFEQLDVSATRVVAVDSLSTNPGTVPVRQAVGETLERVPVRQGYAVLLGTGALELAESIVAQSELKVVAFLDQAAKVNQRRSTWLGSGRYGERFSVHLFDGNQLPTTAEFAALVVGDSQELSASLWADANRVLRPHGGVLWDLADQTRRVRGAVPGEGTWTHQYANVANTCSSGDLRVSDELNLQWFGGPGPRRMVDRHLRGPAPLYGSGVLVVPGENLVIGVDAYTGEELWERALPRSQRYSMPYDAGYLSLFESTLAVSVRDTLWQVNLMTGDVQSTRSLPKDGAGNHWGYVAMDSEMIVGSAQTPSASRTIPSRERIDSDYRNEQAIVTGEAVFAVSRTSGETLWWWDRGLVLNPTLTQSDSTLFFVEANRSENSDGGRETLATVQQAQPRVVALDRRSGQPLWSRPLPSPLRKSRNILYLAYDAGVVVGIGSFLNERRDTTYLVSAMRAEDGVVLWEATHEKGKPGETYHGEQVHHPVIMNGVLVAEPVLYDLKTGARLASGAGASWSLARPGHSCGTLSAGGGCLFFRAGNPTVLDLNGVLAGEAAPKKLSPTRPGCWINVIPAGGLVLIPEASAGCVCDFSLQTSMAFRPGNSVK